MAQEKELETGGSQVKKMTNHDKQIASVLVSMLGLAEESGGILVNPGQKAKPQMLYKNPKNPDGFDLRSVSAFNTLLLAGSSDKEGYKTSVFTLFSEAQRNGARINAGEHGTPHVWYNWKYKSNEEPGKEISASAYNKLSPDDREKYSTVRNKEVHLVFNLDQTDYDSVQGEAYNKILNSRGSVLDRTPETAKDDKELRMAVNQDIQRVKANMMPVHKDGTDGASYDTSKDVIHLSAQNTYASYPEYVQDFYRQAVSATGNGERLGRTGLASTATEDDKVYEALVTELASAVKMVEKKLPAQIKEENLSMVPQWKELVSSNPKILSDLERDINLSNEMINKATVDNQKIGLKSDQAKKDLNTEAKQQETVKFEGKPSIAKDYKGTWTLIMKPEGENAFAVVPSKEDVGLYFNAVRTKPDWQETHDMKDKLGTKYYNLSQNEPEKYPRYNPYTDASQEKLDRISSVSVYLREQKGEGVKEGEKQPVIQPTIDGNRLPAKEITMSDFKGYRFSADKTAYAKGLTAKVFDQELSAKQKAYENVLMMKNDDSKYVLYVKPEEKEGFAVNASKADLGYYYSTVKKGDDAKIETMKSQLAQKYENITDVDPSKKIDIFYQDDYKKNADLLANVDKANILKKSETERTFSVKMKDGTDLGEKELSKPQFDKLWLAGLDKNKEYRLGLASVLFKNELEEYSKKQGLDKPAEEAKTEQQEKSQQQEIKQQEKPEVKEPVKQEEDKSWIYSLNAKRNGSYELTRSALGSTIEDAHFNVKADSASDMKQIILNPANKMHSLLYERNHNSANGKTIGESLDEAIKRQAKKDLSPLVKQYLDLKQKHPDALLLFRTGDFYETYKNDAEKASKILGITLTKSSKVKDDEGKPLAMAGFPYHALDAYLPKLIRAGERIAICDQLETPKRTTLRSRGSDELSNSDDNKETEKVESKEEGKEEKSMTDRIFDKIDAMRQGESNDEEHEDEKETENRSHGFHR